MPWEGFRVYVGTKTQQRYGTHQQTGPHLHDVLHCIKELCTHCIVDVYIGGRGDKFLLTHEYIPMSWGTGCAPRGQNATMK